MADPQKLVQSSVVVLDYGSFKDTHFKECKVIYRGGRAPDIINCHFDQCEWIFEEGALNTIAFLRGMTNDPGMRPFVIETLLGLDKS